MLLLPTDSDIDSHLINSFLAPFCRSRFVVAVPKGRSQIFENFVFSRRVQNFNGFSRVLTLQKMRDRRWFEAIVSVNKIERGDFDASAEAASTLMQLCDES